MYTYEELCTSMKNRERVTLRMNLKAGPIKVSGLINGIRPEDGSGRCWLVTINDNGYSAEVFIRTP